MMQFALQAAVAKVVLSLGSKGTYAVKHFAHLLKMSTAKSLAACLNMKSLIQLLILIFCISTLFAEVGPPKEFKSALIDTAGALPSSATQFTMNIEKYTSDEETKHYADLLNEKGQDALVEAIRNLENGRIVIANRNSCTLSLARTFVKDGNVSFAR
jgi:hypothetical protein